MKSKLSQFVLFFILITSSLFSQELVEDNSVSQKLSHQVEMKEAGKKQEASLTKNIQAGFKTFVDGLGDKLFVTVPMFNSADRISIEQVIDFSKLANDLQSSDEEIFKYLKSILEKNEGDSNELKSFSYHIKLKESLLDTVGKSFGLSEEYLKKDQNRFVKILAKPLAFEKALTLVKIIPAELRNNFVVPFIENEEALDFIEKVFYSGRLNKVRKNIIRKKAIEYAEYCLIVGRFPSLPLDLKKELSELKFTNEVSDSLKGVLLKTLNDSLQDTLIVDQVFELKKFISDSEKVELSEKKSLLIRDYYSNKKILLDRKGGVPLLILVLALGGVIFTLLYGFIGWKGFKHSINVIQGKFDNPEDEGEVTHFQALTSALSSTVGLGNIGGVAVAIYAGGPGAIFWMWLTALFGMTSKFSSCMFAQVYREIDEETGKVRGGPMYYLSKGIADLYPSFAWLGKLLAVIFAVFCIFGALGGGNLYQGNQTYAIMSSTFELKGDVWRWIIGFVLALSTGLVIIGGIKRIGTFSSKIVPLMCVFYVGTCLFIILSHFADITSVFVSIFEGAFNFKSALFGGFIGIFIQGVKRAAFSNEAGLGSAAIAHAAAKTDEPVREGIVAMIGPFIDTIIICTMTALTILVTKAHLAGTGATEGVLMTNAAFATLGPIFPYLLSIAIFFFAFSSVISWCYYGERSTEYLFGEGSIKAYRIVFVLFVVLGPVLDLKTVIDFSDYMLLSMAFPNILGGLLLYKKGRVLLKDYWDRYKSGEMKNYK